MAASASIAVMVGAAVIRALIAQLNAGTLRPFVWYRIALGLAVIALLLERDLSVGALSVGNWGAGTCSKR